MNTEIRKATLADSDQIFSLVERFAISFSPSRMAFEHSFEHMLHDDSVLIKVAVLEDGIVGYCLAFDHYAFYANGRVTWVEEIISNVGHLERIIKMTQRHLGSRQQNF